MGLPHESQVHDYETGSKAVMTHLDQVHVRHHRFDLSYDLRLCRGLELLELDREDRLFSWFLLDRCIFGSGG